MHNHYNYKGGREQIPPADERDKIMVTITQKEFQQLAGYIKSRYGIYLKKEKEAFLVGRLQRVLDQGGFTSFTDYYNYITNDKSGDAVNTLVNRITVNHTFFMREADHFYYLRDTVLPYLVNTVKDKDLRIWCAASSTGEEPYTLAMVIDDFLGKEKKNWDAKILATDLSSRVLEIAKKGVYDSECIAPLPAAWKMNYLRKIDEHSHMIEDKIKNEVIYRKFNLVDNFYPFKKKFHVIFCRNVMIYFDNETKNKLINRMYDLLADGGYLFIGHSETIAKDVSRFKYLKPAVYRKE